MADVKSGEQTDLKADTQHVKLANSTLEKQLTLDSDELSRPDGKSVGDIYERKVYILNKVMNDHIGMGKFQWQLFLLSGWGWMADNLWLQGVAIILPQVQREFNIQTNIRWMTFSLYCGLICGAAVWGILADVIGRRPSFNITLFIAGIFGIAGGAAPSFVGLGGLLAALGFGLGGNLPVDGMMFLEFIPAKKQYLLTLLSIFWSFGQLLASLVAWAFIANYSCDGNQSNTSQGPDTVVCDVSKNKGWRYTFYTLGAFTFMMFVCRFFVFRLPESPKFYLSKGRDADAVAVLKEVARRNGTPLGDDVISVEILRSVAGQEVNMNVDSVQNEPKVVQSFASMPVKFVRDLKNVSFTPDLSHVKPLFFGWKMATTTTILWILWGLIGLAYPLYNAFLPIYLSEAQGLDGASSVDTTYRNYAIISICGVPGSIIAAFMVELPQSGRKGALGIGTILTGVFLFLFTTANTESGVLGFNCAAAVVQNIMYAVLYCITPEVLPAPHRGTGDGIAASINRVLGSLAPIIGIYSNGTAPLYVAASLFLFSGVLAFFIPLETRGKSAL
ncbi:related to PHO84 - high-affinity inorganic phosphate transporter [Melanopsichium pennsylvanicum]|uniref:Related to PHO84 - high-affinity inorganic phosphate transporter n=1 Tax=Melanopsichium pennsylvanicum TaxID=63383 RepID=A0AAJ4XJI2_9BASI|nr:related to PHO84 - high-affinity inorganic phosphate transporter [Melanopsichium pennsylvanicum]